MHAIETYALVSGAKIGKSFIKEEEIELPKGRYMTFHPHHDKGTARRYGHWEKVVELITYNRPLIKVLQIGGIDDKKYDGCDTSLLGKTNYHSLAYVIKHSVLHLGYDSLPVHLASHYQKKIVAIYPFWAKSSGPYFSNPDDVHALEPDFTKIKPCYSYDDPHRLINNIKPHLIAGHVITSLDEACYRDMKDLR